MTSRYDAVVIGGGPAGAAFAAELALAGRRVVLAEREPGPHHKVCGEFVSREASLYLSELGIDLHALGGVPIDAVRLASTEHLAEARLPFTALSLSRRVLDEALLDRASMLGVEVRRGARVRALVRDGDGWRAELDDGEALVGRQAVLATGKHDLRGWKRPPGGQSDLIGFKLHWTLEPGQAAALARHVELTLFPGGYAGLEPIEGGRANLCLLVRQSRFAALGRGWDALLAGITASSPHLARRLAGASPWGPEPDGAEPHGSRPLAIASIPYGYVLRAGGATTDGLWRLGDQAAVIPSFSGDGISIALHSARLAARCYLEGGTASDYQRRLARDVSGQVWRATLISRALVRPSGRALATAAARAWPRLLRATASWTRVSEPALRRAGVAG